MINKFLSFSLNEHLIKDAINNIGIIYAKLLMKDYLKKEIVGFCNYSLSNFDNISELIVFFSRIEKMFAIPKIYLFEQDRYLDIIQITNKIKKNDYIKSSSESIKFVVLFELV